MSDMPSREYLVAMLDYRPESGVFFWRERPAWTFPKGKYSRERIAAAWNAKFAGQLAFTAVHNTGGFQAVINGEHYPAHRVAWKIVHGDEPQEVVALNGDLSDFRIANLKATDRIYSRKNHTMFAHNTSGVRGVIWDHARNLWRAEIRANGKTHFLGRYKTLSRAAEARKAAERLRGWPDASAGEAGTAETAKTGSVHEHATAATSGGDARKDHP